jgi:hypothetical protein
LLNANNGLWMCLLPISIFLNTMSIQLSKVLLSNTVASRSSSAREDNFTARPSVVGIRNLVSDNYGVWRFDELFY